MPQSYEILLIYPGERFPQPRLPVSLLALASYLSAHGHSCKIIDERIDNVTSQNIKAAAIIGISTMSGMQLKAAIKTAVRIKKLRPDSVIVWGGAHPSAFPEQTAQSRLVDYVVKSEGEQAFLTLCERILQKKSIDDIPALTYKRGASIVDNPVADAWIEPGQLPFPRYELFDLTKYADYSDGLSYETSRGCPFRCSFCYVDYFHKRKWRGKSVEKVVADLSRIKKDIGVKKVVFVDDNFFGNRTRSMEICSRMAGNGLALRWTATARADFLAGCSKEEMLLLQRSGCEILSVGAESGSEATLNEIKKDITTQQVKTAVQNCVTNKIMPAVSFIIGLPGEQAIDRKKTIDFADDLLRIGTNVEINGLFLYAPYPGTPLFTKALRYGYQPKQSLEKWKGWSFSDSRNNPWFSAGERRVLDAISSISRFKYFYHRFEFYSEDFRREKLRSPWVRCAYYVLIKPFSRIVDWRWQHRFFLYAFEVALWKKLTQALFKIT